MYKVVIVALLLVATTRGESPSTYECPGEGIFPHPDNCHNYFVCDSNLYGYEYECMNGRGSFDPKEKVCTFKRCFSAPKAAPKKIGGFECTHVGLFPDPDNIHNFYACGEDLTPIPGNCIQGRGRFDPYNRICVRIRQDGSSTTTTKPE